MVLSSRTAMASTSSSGLLKLAIIIPQQEAKLMSRKGYGEYRGCQWWPERGRAEIFGSVVRHCTKHQQNPDDKSTTMV